MPYQNASNVSNFQQLIEYSNQVSGGWFGVAILISMFVIIMVNLGLFTGKPKEAIAIAAFITTLTAILMNIIRLISNFTLIVTIMIFFATVLLLYIQPEN